MKIHRNLYLFVMYRYPWLKELSNNWPLIVKCLEGYSPFISHKVVGWIHPPRGRYKCNTEHSGLGFMTFCVRKGEEDFICAEIRIIKDVCVTEIKNKAIKMKLNYCIQNIFFPLIIETDSLTAQKVINGI